VPEPAEILQNSSTALAKKSDPFLKKEAPKLSDLEKGLKFFGGQCEVHVANQLILRQKAYELIHDLYLQMGIVRKKDSDLWLSIYDALPNSVTFVAEDDQGCSAGTLTVVFDSPIGLPADELYQKEIDEISNSGRQICEFVSLGISNRAKNPIKILASLIYCAYLHAWSENNSRELIITIHSRFEKFYCRRIFFEKIGPERNYAKVNGAPTVLLKLSLKEVIRLRQTHRIFPFNIMPFSDQRDLELAKKIENQVQPMSVEEFYTFFIEKTDTWEKALPQHKEFIKGIYPANDIDHNEVARLLAREFSKKHHLSEDTQRNTAKIVQR
jgi:hypothetical protein